MFYFYVLYFVNPPQITMSVTELNLIELNFIILINKLMYNLIYFKKLILCDHKKKIKRFSEISNIFIKFA